MKLIDAEEEVLREDPRTRDNKYLWLFMVKVLKKMGYKIYINFDKKLPSPDAMLTERRTILNKRNKFPSDFVAEEGTTYEKPPMN